MRMLRRSLGAGAGLLLAALPALARAAEEAGAARAVERPDDWWQVIAFTLGTVLALFMTAALGWLYQQKRGLHWKFQDPDQPHHDAEGAHL